MTSYRLFPDTNGPSTPVDFGPGFDFVSATGFCVTEGTIYFQGYWWWVCGTEQSTAPQTFCLWQDTDDLDEQGDLGVVVEASVVKSDNLTAGQWNFIPLPQPIPLTQFISYRAATASPRYAPTTNGQFGSGGVYATGITSGPLFAFADATSGNRSDVSYYQSNNCSWGDNTLDPTSAYPGEGSQGLNVWLDIQVTDQVPSGAAYRCWPNQPNPLYPPEAALPFTVSTQMAVTQTASVKKLWFLSQTGNQKLPSICGIWDTATQEAVAGSVNNSPNWLLADGSAATPGAGWCYCDYSAASFQLEANHNYRVAVGMYTPGFVWYSGAQGYWLNNGGGYPSQGLGAAHGAGNGIIACVPCGLDPNPLSPCPQDTSGGWAYPNEVEIDGDNYYLDLEVAPASGGSPVVNSSAFLVFFP
ncbi:MAG: hypothetical protein ACRDRJ_01040 [Streptosporangiaceae bacterium]